MTDADQGQSKDDKKEPVDWPERHADRDKRQHCEEGESMT